MTALLTARHVTKRYGGVRVLDAVDFDLEPGEVHALVGENGAGKSTLVKILSGAVAADAGDVRLDATPLPPGDPIAARRRGVAVVYQEPALVPDLSVADNLFLGREPGRFWLDRERRTRLAAERLEAIGVRLDAHEPVSTLSPAHQQLVDIAKALEADARVMILDEPSSSLSGHDVERLLDVVRRLRARGLGVVYVSHRLEEVLSLADRVTVLRDGRRVASSPVAGLDQVTLIRWMVGRDVSEEFPARTGAPGGAVLEVHNLSHPSRFSGVSFTVRQGEILGLAGLVGSGRTAVGLALAGALSASGDVRLSGVAARYTSPSDAIAHGVAYVTEDRTHRGLFPFMSTAANVTVTSLARFARLGIVRTEQERAAAQRAMREFDVRAASLDQPAGTLSGGNQQKLLLARFLLERRQVVILDEPTRGVDVGARAEIYGLMNRLATAGLAIVMISSDLPELLGMSDRIVVMRRGCVSGILQRAEATPEVVMALAMEAA